MRSSGARGPAAISLSAVCESGYSEAALVYHCVCLVRVKGGIVSAFVGKPGIESMSRLGAHRIARKPSGPLSTQPGLSFTPPPNHRLQPRLELKPRKRTLFVLRPPSFERQMKPNDDHNRVDHVDGDCRGILKALLRLRDEHPEET